MRADIIPFPAPWSDRDLLAWVELLDRVTDKAALRGYPPEDWDLIIRLSAIAYEKGRKTTGNGRAS